MEQPCSMLKLVPLPTNTKTSTRIRHVACLGAMVLEYQTVREGTHHGDDSQSCLKRRYGALSRPDVTANRTVLLESVCPVPYDTRLETKIAGSVRFSTETSHIHNPPITDLAKQSKSNLYLHVK